MLRLLRPPLAASFWRSFRLHSPRYARETIAKNLLARDALVTASMTQTGSRGWGAGGKAGPDRPGRYGIMPPLCSRRGPAG